MFLGCCSFGAGNGFSCFWIKNCFSIAVNNNKWINITKKVVLYIYVYRECDENFVRYTISLQSIDLTSVHNVCRSLLANEFNW